MRLPRKNAPRWLVFVADMCISFVGLVLSYMVRFDTLNLPFDQEYATFIRGVPLYLLIRGGVFLGFQLYSSMLRHTATSDVKRVVAAVTGGTFLLIVVSFFKYWFYGGVYLFPISIIAVEYLVSTSFLLAFRFAVKLAYIEQLKKDKALVPTVIYGAGTYGLITKNTIERGGRTDGKVICFVDDDENKPGKSMEGVKIFHTGSLQEIIRKKKIERLIVAINHPNKKNKRHVIETCLSQGVEVLNVPSPENWVNGEFTVGQIQPVRIEDLLGRESITLSGSQLMPEFNQKVILVTGAAGSIGSELVRQLIQYAPKKVILFDQSESALYHLDIELRERQLHHLTETVVGDIRNDKRLHHLFETVRPDIVFHAAAYKHVPLMEENPCEAVLTNIKGTTHLIDLSIDYAVKKFVLISTDKAVNPTNVMGCSKRIAEMYTQSVDAISETRFITTRFGNVLGSNGSVIPLFKKQIEAGGPITVTDRDVRRFFMTIPEACDLVLEAATMGKGGEIFAFDMGESIKIYDLALKMIKLSGLEFGKDIDIRITGLRPGEKLYEEVLADDENVTATHHPQIRIARVRAADFRETKAAIDELIALIDQQDSEAIVKCMKWMVPEYKSNNSTYERLDSRSSSLT